ncbi:MAG: hypothetical protein JNM63_10835, partial [Spirochaetia bacterium]|nr:hypothetical protein [Spirochaetia bacterium]
MAADSSVLSLSESPAPPPQEKLPLPAYAFNTALDNAQFTEISNDLFFRDRDSRKVKVFQAMCQHAEQTGNARMYFDTLLRFVLNKGNTGITVELNLHSTLLEVARALEEKGYVRIITPPGQTDPDLVILQDPVVDKILTYLDDQLGIANRIAVNRGRIPKAGTFPTMTQLSSRFDLTPEQSRDLFLSVGATEYEDDFFTGNPGRMVQIHFQEDYSKPFDLVFPTDVDLRSVVKLAVTLLKEFQESNSRYTDEIRSRLNTIPEMNRQPIEPVIQGLLSGNEILADQKYVHWSSVSRQFACGADFLSHPERYVTLEASADSLDTGKYLYVGQAAALVYHYLINSREHLKKKQWEKEAEYNDRKKLFHFLIEECRSRVPVTSPGGLSVMESVFYPVGLDTLQAQNDSSGQMTFKEKYTDTRLQEILRVEGDDVVPQVIRLSVEEKPIFFHRFRLIDVVYAACSSEHNSIKKKIVQEWAGLPPRDVPKRKDFKVSWEDLSPQFTEILAYAYRVIDSHPMVEDMVKILFPYPSDISAYNLLNSDLVQSAETQGVK